MSFHLRTSFTPNSDFDPVKATTSKGKGDRTPPKAKLVGSTVTAKGRTTFDFKVIYTDTVGLKTTSINSRNLLVTGPNGFRQVARLVGKPRLNKKGTRAIATYRIAAPGGNWDLSDNGAYTVSVLRRRISDKSRNFVKPGKLGKGFLVNIPNESPTAALGTGTIGVSDYTFTVTYSDEGAINAASIDNSDIQVTGPGGFSQLAQRVSVTPAGNGSPLTATYRITSPNGVWTITNDGTYAIALVGNQVTDTLGAAAVAKNLGSFTVEASKIPPSASVTGGGDITNAGADKYEFTVTYADNDVVNVATLGNGDVRVTGPNGFNQVATFVGVDVNSNGSPRSATYRISAPGGRWDGPDAGTYTVSMEPNQVSDGFGNVVPTGAIGSFAVNIEQTAPTVSLEGAPLFNQNSGSAYIAIRFSDNAGVNAASLGSRNILVTGPNGYSQFADFVRVDPAGNGGSLVATYRINAPGGSWTGADDGAYTVSVLSGQVSDINLNVTPQSVVGDFQVRLTPFRREAESFQLGGFYGLENLAIASGGQLIRLNPADPNATAGTATTTFDGPAGSYDLVIRYFDENDGTSNVQLLVNGSPVAGGSWNYDDDFGTDNAVPESGAWYTIKGVQLTPGATITLQGTRTAPGTSSTRETARVDYIDFIPLHNTAAPTNTSPGAILGKSGDNTVTGTGAVNTVDYSQVANGIIADLSANSVLKPIYDNVVNTPKIMPMGDANTLGGTSGESPAGSYRIRLRQSFLDNDLSLDFVGSQTQAGTAISGNDNQHEAYSAASGELQGLITVTNGDSFGAQNPDVVLLMAGSASSRTSSLAQMKDALEQLINNISTKLPNALLLVGSIPPTNTKTGTDPVTGDPIATAADIARTQRTIDYNALLPGIVANAVASGKKVAFFDVNKGVTNSDLATAGVNLNQSGQTKVGNNWFDALIDKDTLTGIQNIVGTGFGDSITGNASANIIEGGGGADKLTGNSGSDTFVYRNVKDGGDTITDFTGDLIQISASGFGGGLVAGVGLASGTASATGTFVSSNTPVGTGANFLYSGGVLSFDPDGTGAQGAVAIATLTGSPALTANRISIIA